ncbi:MAG: hypothetical protein ACNA7U_06850 [Candidatus Izemoplasmataceae bacterium]|jgi:hypothetical protein|uniref:hypothetical protein n=1 Tax=Liberiplasma polymorphum TaxID=3374570 RepID=UPI003771C0F4
MKLLISSIVLILMSGFWYASAGYNPYEQSDAEGAIQIIVIDEFGEIVVQDTISFNDEDTLLSLLLANYHVTTQPSVSSSLTGTVILGIDTVVTDFESDFIRILIDGYLYDRNGDLVEMNRKMSSLGIDLIPLIDGNTYIFEYAQVNGKGGNS